MKIWLRSIIEVLGFVSVLLLAGIAVLLVVGSLIYAIGLDVIIILAAVAFIAVIAWLLWVMIRERAYDLQERRDNSR